MAELPKLYIDNPGGDWLQRKLETAQEDYRTAPLGSSRRNYGSSDVTGYFKTALDLSPDLLKDLPGALGEEAWREDSVKLENLEKRIREQGYEPSPILINVREDGQPFIVEGNHRVVEALKSGRTSIPVDLRYLRGAEDVKGPLSMDRLREVYEPRPKDQPRAPLLLEGPSEEKTGKEPSKGRMFRGIGSLMRGRNILSLLQGLREGYELLPEEYQVLDEAWQYLKGTEFNPFDIDKPGIESFKELLGISPEDLGETIPLPKVQKSEADRMSRAHKLGFTVDAYHYTAAPEDFEEFLAGGPDYEKASGRSALETGIQLSGPGVWFSSSPEDLESGAGWKGYRDVGHKKKGGRVIPARLRIEEPLYLDLFNQEEMADRWVEADVGRPESLSWYKQEFPMLLNQPTVDKLRAAGFDTIIDEGSGAGFDHKGGPEYIVLDTRNIRARSAKFDPEESKSADMSKAAGGFIDKPLYDDQRMIG
jgi:hypothetical protein